MDTLTTTLDDQGILTVAIDVPNESMNVLNQALAQEFDKLTARIEDDNGIRSVILISGKDNSFVAGADIKMLQSVRSFEETRQLIINGHELFQRVSESSKPFVAAIHGPCLGGGLELALACHYRIATDDTKTKIGLPEVMLGLLPGGRGASLVPRMVNLPQALDLLLTGRQLNAKRARRLGLIDEVVPSAILKDVARKTALNAVLSTRSKRKQSLRDRILRMPGVRGLILRKARQQVMKTTRGLYPAPLAILEVAETSLSSSLIEALEVESTRFAELAMSAEANQLMNIYFASNDLKKERFIESDVNERQVNRVGILGGGLMGAGIALVSIDKANVAVRMKDIRHEGILSACRHVDTFYSKRVKRRVLSQEQAKKRMSRFSGTLDYSGFDRCDLVIEAVFEDLILKQQMLSDVEILGNEDTVFATNTSSIPVAEIAANAIRPGNVLGMHYFSPVEKMPLLEIIRHSGTSDQAVATAVAFGRKQGKTVVVVKDGPGFYVNRILAPYINAAMRCGMDGVPFNKIDQALVNFGFPVGPFKLLDEVGIDVGSKVQPILEEAYGSRMLGSDLQKKLVESNRVGKKAGKGFYRYDKPKNSKTIDETIYQELGISPHKQISESQIVDQCLLMMLNEAVFCLQDGTIFCPRDGDIAAVFGIGFPPFLGGPFRYMDQRGLSVTVAAMRKLQKNVSNRYEPAPLLIEMAEKSHSFYDDIQPANHQQKDV